MWQSLGLTVLVIVATLICVLLFMLFGWYVVWQLFLSKFKFLRELVGDTGSPQVETEPSESESERSSPPTPAIDPNPHAKELLFQAALHKFQESTIKLLKLKNEPLRKHLPLLGLAKNNKGEKDAKQNYIA